MLSEKETAYLVYKHTSPNGKAYIGQTNNYSKRSIQHQDPKSYCRVFAKAIKKYGWDNFTHEILEDNLTLEEANVYENLYIVEHNTLSPNGYNLTTGGDNCKISEETKRLMSEAHRTPEAIAAHSEKQKQYWSNPKARLAAAEKTKQYNLDNPKARIANSKSKKQYWDNPEKRALLAEKRKQYYLDNPEAGSLHSAKVRKEWLIISPAGESLVVKNLKEFCQEMGFNYYSMATKNGSTYKGYKIKSN